MARRRLASIGIDDKDHLIAEIAAWERNRNVDNAKINWMFTTKKAREKLRKAYPINESYPLCKGISGFWLSLKREQMDISFALPRPVCPFVSARPGP
jgi:hypothetical protein